MLKVHYSYHFIVYLNVTDSDSDGLIELISNFLEDLTDGSGYYASVLEVSAGPSHSEGFSCSCLSIAQDSSIVALHHRRHCFTGCCFIHFILTIEKD